MEQTGLSGSAPGMRVPDIEAVILTGGASRRMGVEKAAILVDGHRADVALCSRVLRAGFEVTVLGNRAVEGCAFVADALPFGGPAVALSRFVPQRAYVFVLACDVLRFDSAFIAVAARHIGDCDVAAPVVGDTPQPLCALYRAACWKVLREIVGRGERRMRRWLGALTVRLIPPEEIAAAGLDPRCVEGANTPEELRHLFSDGA